MYKLIVSENRYDALLYASHMLDNRSVLITISDGMDELNKYGLCWEALKIQKKFEVEKAYKIFGIRQLYCFNQSIHNIDYQFVLVKLQLMLTVSPFTHLCFLERDSKLSDIYNGVIGGMDRIIYLEGKTDDSLVYTLNDEELERKLNAIEKMATIREQLLYTNDYNREYIKRIV